MKLKNLNHMLDPIMPFSSTNLIAVIGVYLDWGFYYFAEHAFEKVLERAGLKHAALVFKQPLFK